MGSRACGVDVAVLLTRSSIQCKLRMAAAASRHDWRGVLHSGGEYMSTPIQAQHHTHMEGGGGAYKGLHVAASSCEPAFPVHIRKPGRLATGAARLRSAAAALEMGHVPSGAIVCLLY